MRSSCRIAESRLVWLEAGYGFQEVVLGLYLAMARRLLSSKLPKPCGDHRHRDDFFCFFSARFVHSDHG